MPPDAQPLTTPVFQILLALIDQPLHGYAIIQDIEARTGGEVMLTASTLYAALKRLLDTGLIDELKRAPAGVTDDDPRRRYYRLGPAGMTAARSEAARLERQAALARDKRLLPALKPHRRSAAR